MENLIAISQLNLKKSTGFDYHKYEVKYLTAVLCHLFEKSLNSITVTSQGEAIVHIDASDYVSNKQENDVVCILFHFLSSSFRLKNKTGKNQKCWLCYQTDCQEPKCMIVTNGIEIKSTSRLVYEICIPLRFLQTLTLQDSKHLDLLTSE